MTIERTQSARTSQRVSILKVIGRALLGIALALGAAPSICAPEPVSSDEKPTFDILEYRVLGNTVLTPVDIESAIYPHLGVGKTIDSVEDVRKLLEQLYRDRGYGTVFVDIPEQDVNQGIVRLRVTEGRLDRVRISGARYFENGRIRNAVPSLQRGSVLHLPQLQDELMKVNREARDRSITPVLRAGRAPGMVDVDLKVKDELPLHASAEVNDRYTADTSKTRVSATVSYDNFWQRYHSLSLQYQTAPKEPDEARVLAATYVAPLQSGHTLAAYAVDTDSEVATVGTLAVLGKGRIYGLRYIVPLPESANYFHGFTFGGDFKDFEEDVRIDVEQGLKTPIQYAAWTAGYNGNLRRDTSETGFNLGASFGIRGLANSPQEFELKRFKGKPNFFYLRADAYHEHTLPWRLQIALRFGGQFATEPLVSNEQFAIGGFDSVRGYLESEELGDYGASGSFELRSLLLNQLPLPVGAQLYPFVFYDAGVVRIVEPLPDQETGTTLASFGAGLRLSAFGGLEGSLDWAKALRDTDRARSGDDRIHFKVRYGF